MGSPDPSVIRQPVRHRLWWRLLVWLVAGVVGVAGWFYARSQLGHKPLYEIEIPHDSATIRTTGPWLYIGTAKSEQFRNIQTGALVRKLDKSRPDTYFAWVPGTDYFLRACHAPPPAMQVEYSLLSLVNGQSQSKFKVNRESTRYGFSASKRFAVKIVMLPVHAFQYLAAFNWGTLCTADFLSFLSTHETVSPISSIPLVEVIDCISGQCVHRCTLPLLADSIGSPQLLNDGEHLLVSSSFNSGMLGQYLSRYNTTPEQKADVVKNMPGLRMISCRTGEVVKEWPELKAVGVNFVGDDMVLLQNDARDPFTHWSKTNIQKKHQWYLLNTQTLKLKSLNLPPSTSSVHPASAKDGFFLLTFEYHQVANSQWLAHHYRLERRNLAGDVLEKYKLDQADHNGLTLVPDHLYIIIDRHGFGLSDATMQKLDSFPWLRDQTIKFATQSMIDLRTGEPIIQVSSMQKVIEPSEDGKYLLVHDMHREDFAEHRVVVYAMPSGPLPWYSTWLPRLLGLVLFLGILYLGLRRKHYRPAVPN